MTYLTCFIFGSSLCRAWYVMIWFLKALLAPLTRAPSIWEPTSPDIDGIHHKTATWLWWKWKQIREVTWITTTEQETYCMYARTTNSARWTLRFSSNSILLSLISKEILKKQDIFLQPVGSTCIMLHLTWYTMLIEERRNFVYLTFLWKASPKSMYSRSSPKSAHWRHNKSTIDWLGKSLLRVGPKK